MKIKKPKWLKPTDLDKPKFWIHAIILAIVILGIMQLFRMFVLTAAMASLFTVKNIAILAGLIGLGDIIVHTLLRYD